MSHDYKIDAQLNLNEWGLTGTWTVGSESAVLNKRDGTIAYELHARDLHLILGTSADGKRVRFRVRIDGMPPGDDHGADTDVEGYGQVIEERLYQLVRQKNVVTDK